jgi:hypothetical protein
LDGGEGTEREENRNKRKRHSPGYETAVATTKGTEARLTSGIPKQFLLPPVQAISGAFSRPLEKFEREVQKNGAERQVISIAE